MKGTLLSLSDGWPHIRPIGL